MMSRGDRAGRRNRHDNTRETVSNARFLRVITFQALGSDSAIDGVLRSSVVPQLLEQSALVDAWQGRRGATDNNHILASTWTDDPEVSAERPPDLAALADPVLAVLGGA